jgi:hypothetical protein
MERAADKRKKRKNGKQESRLTGSKRKSNHKYTILFSKYLSTHAAQYSYLCS